MSAVDGVPPDAWGRVADDGTVRVRTSQGERVVGVWRAGAPGEGIAFYARRYEELDTRVHLLEQRLATDPRGVRSAARKLLQELPTANAVGDLEALDTRLQSVVRAATEQLASADAARASTAAAATARRRELVGEAEALVESTEWKSAGDRYRAIFEEWTQIKGGERAADAELWRRLRTARQEFERRRGTHFASLDQQRKEATARKETLITEAETVSTSSDWTAGARRFRELMTEWKAAGSAGRAVEAQLWPRFRAAQDAFFSRRSAALGERDKQLRENLVAKEAVLTEAEAVDPTPDPAAAQRRLRELRDRWSAAGPVPRDALVDLDRRWEVVEQRVRSAAEAGWRRPDPQSSALVARLRESVAKLEVRLARARAEGRDDDARRIEESLATQRGWLAQAE